MQVIKIKAYEAGTIIPNCGLDQPTDALRNYFQMSLEDFQHSFDNPESPGRWLYYLLSTQRYLDARLTLLVNHIEVSQLHIQKLEINHQEQLHENGENLSGTARKELIEKIEKIDKVKHLLQTIFTRLKAPQEQVVRLKQIRMGKVEQFGQRYAQLRQQLIDALTAGGLANFTKNQVNAAMAYLFEVTRKDAFLQDKLEEQSLNPKILAAVEAIVPTRYFKKISEILTHSQFWKILGCNRNIPIAMAVTPVIVSLLQEFEVFTSTHDSLIVQVEKMKQALKGIEKFYAESLMNCQIPTIVDKHIQDIYTSKLEPSVPTKTRPGTSTP